MLGYNIDIDNLPLQERITFLRRWVLVNSILYYEMDYNMYNDKMYDSYAKLLATLQNEHKELCSKIELDYVFKHFDASTGFNLYHELKDKDKTYFTEYAKHCKYVSQRRKQK